MALPAFDENGYLPKGIHACSWPEFRERFGAGSVEREVQVEELEACLEWARRAGVRRMLVDGSFVTTKSSPNDVDVVILAGLDYPRSEKRYREKSVDWTFIHLQFAVDDADFERWGLTDFGFDRLLIPRGVVEVML